MISSAMEMCGHCCYLSFGVGQVDVVAGEESVIGRSLWEGGGVEGSLVGCYVSWGECVDWCLYYSLHHWLSNGLDGLKDWCLDDWCLDGLEDWCLDSGLDDILCLNGLEGWGVYLWYNLFVKGGVDLWYNLLWCSYDLVVYLWYNLVVEGGVDLWYNLVVEGGVYLWYDLLVEGGVYLWYNLAVEGGVYLWYDLLVEGGVNLWYNVVWCS